VEYGQVAQAEWGAIIGVTSAAHSSSFESRLF